MTGAPDGRHGGVNRVWKVPTERGTFAIHLLLGLPAGVDTVERCQQVLDLELAVAKGGVRIAQPVPEPGSGRACVRIGPQLDPVIVHEWVNAQPANIDRSPPELYRRLGSSLARVHALDHVAAATPAQEDVFTRAPSADEWRDLASEARREGWRWADAIHEAAGELEAALVVVDGWDRDGGDRVIFSHRDLTSENVLDHDGEPVLIDWEDAGPIGQGTEIGRTALDNLGRDGQLDPIGLRAYLEGYHEVLRLPAIGPHWCSLWVRGLVVYANHCARSCLDGAAAPSMLRQQAAVLEQAVPELRRRLAAIDAFVRAFEHSRPRSS